MSPARGSSCISEALECLCGQQSPLRLETNFLLNRCLPKWELSLPSGNKMGKEYTGYLAVLLSISILKKEWRSSPNFFSEVIFFFKAVYLHLKLNSRRRKSSEPLLPVSSLLKIACFFPFCYGNQHNHEHVVSSHLSLHFETLGKWCLHPFIE